MLGSPVGHSLSPVLHRAAYAHLGLTGWTYDAYDVDEAGLAGFLAGLDPSWAGLSLTMPLKAAVLPLLDAASPLVETVGRRQHGAAAATAAGWGRTPTSRAWSPRWPRAGSTSVDRAVRARRRRDRPLGGGRAARR